MGQILFFSRLDSVHFGSVPDLSHLRQICPILGPNLVTQPKQRVTATIHAGLPVLTNKLSDKIILVMCFIGMQFNTPRIPLYTCIKKLQSIKSHRRCLELKQIPAWFYLWKPAFSLECVAQIPSAELYDTRRIEASLAVDCNSAMLL